MALLILFAALLAVVIYLLVTDQLNLVAAAAGLLLAGEVWAQPVEHLPAVPTQIELVQDARNFFQRGAAAAGTVSKAVESINLAVYLSGIKDGVVGSALLGLVGFLLLCRKA